MVTDAYSAWHPLLVPTFSHESRRQKTGGGGGQQHDGEERVLQIIRPSRRDESELLALEHELVGLGVDPHAIEGEVETVLEVPVVEVVVHVANHAVDAILQRAHSGPLASPVVKPPHKTHLVKSVFSERELAYSSDISSALSAHRLLKACVRSREASLTRQPIRFLQCRRRFGKQLHTQQAFRVDALHHIRPYFARAFHPHDPDSRCSSCGSPRTGVSSPPRGTGQMRNTWMKRPRNAHSPSFTSRSVIPSNLLSLS